MDNQNQTEGSILNDVSQQPAGANQQAGTPIQPGSSNLGIDEENRKANTLCIWSLVCMFGAPVVMVILGMITNALEDLSNGSGVFSVIGKTFIGTLSSAGIVAWVLVIIALAKYKQAKFPKVLICVYAVLLALKLIAVIILFAFLGALIASCA